MRSAAVEGRFPADLHRRRDTLIVLGIVAIGAVLRLHHLGAPSFWLDEALSVAYAQLPWPRFAHLMATRELNMLPYYLILRAWIHLGTSEWVVRSLSVICSVLTLPIFYRLGVRLFGERVGLIALTLLSLHPYHIRFAQEARGYSLMVLLVTASTLALVHAAESTSRRPARTWTTYVATSVLAAYAHFYGSLALVAQWMSFAVTRPRALSRHALARAIAAICILLIPIAAFVLLGHADPAGWIPRPAVRRVEYFLYSVLGGDNTPGARVFVYPVYVAALLAFVASVRAAWHEHSGDDREWHHSLLIFGALLPVAIVLVVSMGKPIFVDKYLIECLPFAVLILAVGVDHLQPRMLSLGVLLAILTISAHALVAYYDHSDKDDWRSATRYVLTSARRDDVALFVPRYADATFRYYRNSLDTAMSTGTAIYPRTLDAGDVNAVLAAVRHQHGRVWAIFNQDGDAGAAIRDSLAHQYAVSSDSQFTGVRVVLYDVP